MTEREHLGIVADEEYGPKICCDDYEIADQFEDFLNANYEVLYHIKYEHPYVTLYFGRAASAEKIESMLRLFLQTRS